MKRLKQLEEEAEAVQLPKDPKRAELELRLLGVATIVKKEGIDG